MSKNFLVPILLFISFFCLSIANGRLNASKAENKQQAETIEFLRGELQRYAAIEKIINSRCLDNLEPVPMEVE